MRPFFGQLVPPDHCTFLHPPETMPKVCPTCKKTFAHLPAHLNKKNKCAPPAITLDAVAERLNLLEIQVATLTSQTPTPAETNTLILENKAISLFSGAGGDTCGLERAG